ncbi:MAG: hypothetical protein NTY95_09015 [Bacteroidia bacterium]|nr:hypothetical protein [Bacteroidia bacterium]
MNPEFRIKPPDYMMSPANHEAINGIPKMVEVINEINICFHKIDVAKVTMYDNIAKILFDGKIPPDNSIESKK